MPAPALRHPSRGPFRRRRGLTRAACPPRLLALVLAVLLAHALVLDRLGSAEPPAEGPPPRGAVTVFVVAGAAATPPAARAQRHAGPGRTGRTAAAEPAAPAAAAAPLASSLPADRPDPALPGLAGIGGGAFEVGAEDGGDTDAADRADAASAAPPPVYPTRPAPAARRHYVQQRDGEPPRAAVLDWQPGPDSHTDGQGWRLQLDTGPGTGWASQGTLDTAGLAPRRLVEQRRGRERRAVNFQREQGVVSFSGPAVQHPLHAGAQDRLSWLLQLGAVLNADPALATPGAQLVLWVAGPGGHGGLWTFEVRAADGATVHLHRAAQRPWDTDIDVWLDPADHHLPRRWQLQLRGNGRRLVFERAAAAP